MLGSLPPYACIIHEMDMSKGYKLEGLNHDQGAFGKTKARIK